MTAVKEEGKEKQDAANIHAIKVLIQTFFDRINDSDPKGLQKLFDPHAHLTIIRQDPPRAPSSSSPWAWLPVPESQGGSQQQQQYPQHPVAAAAAADVKGSGSGRAKNEEEEEEEEKEKEEKLTVVLRTAVENFIRMIEDGEKKRRDGTLPPGPKLHEAPDLEATEVRLDGRFAAAWAPFRVTFDGTLHHYGELVYTLGKKERKKEEEEEKGITGSRWMVVGLTQTYRRTPGWEAQGSELM